MRSQLRHHDCPLVTRVGNFAAALKMKKSWHGKRRMKLFYFLHFSPRKVTPFSYGHAPDAPFCQSHTPDFCRPRQVVCDFPQPPPSPCAESEVQEKNVFMIIHGGSRSPAIVTKRVSKRIGDCGLLNKRAQLILVGSKSKRMKFCGESAGTPFEIDVSPVICCSPTIARRVQTKRLVHGFNE